MFKINALRVLMTGKAKEYFDPWGGDRDNTDAAKSYEELLNKVKAYSRRRKLDNTAQRNTQHGGDHMDVGAVNANDNSCNKYWEEDEIDAVGAFGWKGKGKGKGKSTQGGSQCFIRGSSSHFAKDCPNKGT